jgi:arylformamidase
MKPDISRKNKIYDISPLISEQIAVWPGDTPFSREWLTTIAGGSNIDLSTMRSTVHLGAHTDAPRHYHSEGKSIDEVALEPYLGSCYVVATTESPLITERSCKKAIELGFKRILFRTLSQPDPNVFNTDFVAFSASAVEYMGRHKVALIGIDTPSVDPFESKELPAHQALHKYQMRNIEGLVLADVPEGEYELIALPLKLKGFDASPVRAILRTLV